MIKSILGFILIILVLRYVARLFQVTNASRAGSQQQQRNEKQPYIKVEKEEPLHHKKNPHHTTEDAEYIEYEEVDDK